jgi:23S rRNA (guanosine2251-2'-O)-methyltransferase
MAAARERQIPVRMISRSDLISMDSGARDVALEVSGSTRRRPQSLDEAIAEVADNEALVLVLDHLTDPHNVGAVLRTADQFGADFVLVPGKRAAPLTSTVVESSAGTAPYVTVITVPNVPSAVKELQSAGFWVYAAAMDGAPLHRCNLTGRVALVVGNEGKGVSRLVAERSDERVSIPRTGRADSLNVSVAAGILAYEVRRQQKWIDRSHHS